MMGPRRDRGDSTMASVVKGAAANAAAPFFTGRRVGNVEIGLSVSCFSCRQPSMSLPSIYTRSSTTF